MVAAPRETRNEQAARGAVAHTPTRPPTPDTPTGPAACKAQDATI